MATSNRFSPPVVTHTDILDLPAEPRPAATADRPPAGLAWWALLALGVGLRVAATLQPWSFWYDEACLALNLQTRSAAELVTRPLDLDQASPPGFLLLSKLAAVTLGDSEQALRFLPGVGSVLGLFLFAAV